MSPQHEQEELAAQREEETARWTDGPILDSGRPFPKHVETSRNATADAVNAWKESEAERWRRIMLEDEMRERAQ